MRPLNALRAMVVVLVLTLLFPGRTPFAQGLQRTQPTCIQNVGLPTTADPDARVTLVLRDGRITEILLADAAAPAGTRVVDGAGLVALPAFLDAYTRTGLERATPVKDQDLPVDVGSGVRVDMRIANRKGIQPAFRAADNLTLSADEAQAWRESGFGVALVAPSGELLSGTSTLAATRPAAARDLVVTPEVFAHAAFSASGPGYPSTLMGYFAQLRQFFLDARWQDELERRHQAGRPGARPSFDVELRAASPLLGGTQRLACEAESARDIERWMKLADQFGLTLAVVGGNDAARVGDVLAARDIPVVLTLNWGKEVKDPEAKEKAKEDAEPEPEEAEAEAGADADSEERAHDHADVESAPEEDQEETQEDAEDDSAADDAEPEEAEPNWTYETPLAVRVERRRLWEERRDVALRLAEQGVHFAFGSSNETPKKLLEKVRTLVEAGLPRETAQAALTGEAARMLGADRHLGRIAAGFDATLTLWTADPLTEKEAQVAWSFVDGYGAEFEIKEVKPDANGEPGDAAGTWSLEASFGGDSRESTLVLTQDDEGGLTGTLSYSIGEGDQDETTIAGKMRGSSLELEATVSFGEMSVEMTLEGSIEGNSFEGTASYAVPFSEDPLEAEVTGSRTPEVLLELDSHTESCHEDHNAFEAIR